MAPTVKVRPAEAKSMEFLLDSPNEWQVPKHITLAGSWTGPGQLGLKLVLKWDTGIHTGPQVHIVNSEFFANPHIK